MNRIPKARYTREFREEGHQAGRGRRRVGGVAAASRRLSVPLQSLANWLRAVKAGKLEEVGDQQKPQMELEAELHRVKRELAEVKMERDLLKKFAAYFANESR